MTSDPDCGRKMQNSTETSREAVLDEVRAYEAARLGNQAWVGRAAETIGRLATDSELLGSIERRGF